MGSLWKMRPTLERGLLGGKSPGRKIEARDESSVFGVEGRVNTERRDVWSDKEVSPTEDMTIGRGTQCCTSS